MGYNAIYIIFRILVNIGLVFATYNILKIINSSKNQYEKEEDLGFDNYHLSEVDKDTIFNMQEVMKENEVLNKTLDRLRKTLFFKIFKLNLEPDCTLFKQDLICKSSYCKICSCEKDEVPNVWMQKSHIDESINTKIDDPFYKWVDKFSISTKQWIIEEDVDSINGTFINLLKNPEGYTGYRGSHIWNAIFNENCLSNQLHEMCKEDKTFYRIFSGWLSNTNMQIGINYHNHITNQTYLNVSFITTRLLRVKDRVDNLFFLYSLMIKAVNKAKPLLLTYNYYSGNIEEDGITLDLLQKLYKSPGKELEHLNDAFNETTLDFEYFMHSKKINQLVSRFRNISSIIDCVSCSKCRMHAKLEVFGMATMLKILFTDVDELKTKIIRNELVSFVNLFAKLCKTVSFIQKIDENIKKARIQFLVKYYGSIAIMVIIGIYLNFFGLKRRIVNKGSNIHNMDEIQKKKK